jgi:integrase
MKLTLKDIVSSPLYDGLKKYKSTTQDNVLTSIRFIYKIIDKPLSTFNFDDIESNIDQICNKLQSINVASAQCWIIALIMIYRSAKRDEPEILKTLFKETKAKVKEHDNLKQKEKLHDLNLKDVYDYFKAIELKGVNKLSQSMRRVMLAILINVPLRLNELINLQYEDTQTNNYVDFEKKQLVIRVHKTDKKNGTKILSINDDTVSEIKRHQELYPKKYIFLTNKKPNDDVMDSTSSRHFLQSAIKTYCKAKNLEYKPFGVHNVRHQHATKNINDGIDLKVYKKIQELQKLMGHSNFESTLKYYYKMQEQPK